MDDYLGKENYIFGVIALLNLYFLKEMIINVNLNYIKIQEK